MLIHKEDNAGGKAFARLVFARSVDRLYLWGTGGKKPARNVFLCYELESLDPGMAQWLPAFPKSKLGQWTAEKYPPFRIYGQTGPDGLKYDEGPRLQVVGGYNATNRVRWWDFDGIKRPSPIHTFNMACWDSKRNRIVYYSDGCTFALDPAANAWTDLEAKNYPQTCRTLAWASTCYDPLNDQILLFGGGLATNPSGGAPTWLYDCAENIWRQPKLKIEPPLRCNTPIVYDPVSESMIMFGGYDQSAALNDTWAFDCRTGRWEHRQPELALPPMFAPAAALVPNGGKILICGSDARKIKLNHQFSTSADKETWIYDTTKNVWTSINSNLRLAGYRWLTAAGSHRHGVVFMAAFGPERRTYALRYDASARPTDLPGAEPNTIAWKYPEQKQSLEETPQPDLQAHAEFLKALPKNKFVDAGPPGMLISKTWSTAVIDTDRSEVIYTGGGHRALYVYENDGTPGKENWIRHGNLDSTGKMGLNGACLYDVDGDGDLDVVGAKYRSDLGWWENPGRLDGRSWEFHKLGASDAFLHDLIRADLDGDGEANEFVATLNEGGYWSSEITIKWFRPSENPTQLWESYIIEDKRNEGRPHCHAGLDTGDVDGDGNVDVAFSNGWYEAPDDPAGDWIWHEVTATYGISNTLLRDLDGDTDFDLIVSAGHHGKGVFWFECPPNPESDTWNKHEVDGSLVHPEGLAVLDLDFDGDYEIVTCDLDFDHWAEQVHHVYVYENKGNNRLPTWKKRNISGDSYASHKLQVTDINLDGKMDIISEGCGHKVISYYENRSKSHPPSQTEKVSNEGKYIGTIRNDSVWKDTDGNEIWCNGGHMITDGDTFYWVGYETKPRMGFRSIKLYSSTNLADWKFENNILRPEGPFSILGWAGRPGLLHNRSTGKYVLIIEADSRQWERHKVGFAQCDTINGDYKFVRYVYPENDRSTGDQSVYQEGKDGYLVCTLDKLIDGKRYLNQSLAIFKLTPDFLDIERKVYGGVDNVNGNAAVHPRHHTGREASHIIKVNDVYYWFSSGLQGWNSTQTKYAVSISLSGTWSKLKVLLTDPPSNDSFNTQHDFVIPVVGNGTTTYVYVGDRYSQHHGKGAGRNIFLPIIWEDGQPVLMWRETWRIDTARGAVAIEK